MKCEQCSTVFDGIECPFCGWIDDAMFLPMEEEECHFCRIPLVKRDGALMCPVCRTHYHD
jgi:RNA polymerase subunit RPABC4/transcription elongation factor Spt4